MADNPIPEAPPGYHAAIGRRGGQRPKPRHPREAEMVAAYLAADPPLSYRAIAAQYSAHRSTVMRAVAAQVAEPAARRVIAGEDDATVARECRLDVRTVRAAVKRIRAAEEAAKMEIAELIEKLQEAAHDRAVLEAIWREIGPYGMGAITPDTLRELNRIMKWDDSE